MDGARESKSRETLVSNVASTTNNYRQLHSALESHKIAFIRAQGTVRPEQEIKDARKLEVAQKYLEPTKEVIAKHVVELAKLHTFLFVLFSGVQTDMKTLVSNAFECKIKFESFISNKVRSITIEYKAWHVHLRQVL